MELRDTVLLGDCLDILRQIPDSTFHAVVTDPPYGLGKKEPTPEEILRFVQGDHLTTGDFMGNDWDIPSVAVWKEIYRVLKPGGHVLSFGGTKTFDLISLGLRMAGFESRDTIADFFPAICWVYGSGMPKSYNISKDLDKRVDVKRVKDNVAISPEAKLWDGYGTGLKPSFEPIVVFRKPFLGTVAQNVLVHGTGALNINGCRVKHSSPKDFEAHKAQVEAVRAKGGVRDGSWKNASDLSGASEVSEAGRWPTNMVLSHHPDCRKVGSKKGVRVSHSDEDGTETIEAWECVEGCSVAELDAQSGTLTSGTGAFRKASSKGYQRNIYGKESQPEGPCVVYGDTGGASRFFPQFPNDSGRWPANSVLVHHPDCRIVGSKKVDAPVINRFDDGAKPFGDGAGHPYTSTQTGDADGKEDVPVWECVDGCPIKETDEQSGTLTSGTGASKKVSAKGYQGNVTYGSENRLEGTTWTEYGDTEGASRFFNQFQPVSIPFRYIAKPNKQETSLEGKIENDHPTKKPLELMRWLVRLVTFKGAHILDPYCGSGSTLHAAAEEGVTYTGIERDPHAHEIATKRMDIVSGREQERRSQMDAFDLASELCDEDP